MSRYISPHSRYLKKLYERYRCLDLLDLEIIYLFSLSLLEKEIAVKLNIVPAAITHRLRKHVDAFGEIYERGRHYVRLNEDGKAVAQKAKKILKLFELI